MNGPCHAVTVDVEDWPQSTLDHDLPITERAVRNTHGMLQLFADHQVRGTFFILGLLADKFPGLVRDILSAGHEIASHGYSHRALFHIGPEAFAEELKRSCGQLEDITGQPVRGYRAPDFSITQQSLWALDLIARQGLTYDSSIVPVKMRRYGISHIPPHIHQLPSGLVEAPLSTVRFAGCRWPVAGGGYLRLLPGMVTSWAIRRLQRQDQPAIVYLHPYEIDPAEFRHLPWPVPFKTRLTQGLNRSRVKERLARLFREFQFTTLSEVIDRTLSPQMSSTADNHPATC